MWKFIGLTYLFLERERWVKNPNFVTSNMYVNSPDQWRISYLTCRPSLIFNKEWIKPRKHGWLVWTNIRLRKTISEALFFFGVLFIHQCKTFIKADQTSSFYPSMNDILYQKYLKKTKCHCDNVFLSEATKTSKQKARISHFRSTSGQQFCSRISCLHTFGRP